MGKNGMKSKVVLAVGAHPDDIDFGASGTIAKWAEEGAQCYYLICTDGSRGSTDPKMTHKRLANIRKKEQGEAAKILGVKKVYFLDYTDTLLTADYALRRDIAKIIKIVKPNIVVTMDPTFYYSEQFNFINHTDHRAAALATMDSCYPLARDRLTFPEHEKEGLAPHLVEEVWFIAFEKDNLLIDVTKTFPKKIEALSKHKSQFEDFDFVIKRLKERARYFGIIKGCEYAENFVRIKLF